MGKAYLNALFAVKASMVPGQIRRINLEARSELAWWDWLLDNWTGVSVHQFLLLRHPDHHQHTDASGAWGCSAWSLPHWFQMQWSPRPPFPVSLLKSCFPSSWLQQCGGISGLGASFSATATTQPWCPKSTSCMRGTQRPITC